MNATASVEFLDSPRILDGTVERLLTVKALGLDAGLGELTRRHNRARLT